LHIKEAVAAGRLKSRVRPLRPQAIPRVRRNARQKPVNSRFLPVLPLGILKSMI